MSEPSYNSLLLEVQKLKADLFSVSSQLRDVQYSAPRGKVRETYFPPSYHPSTLVADSDTAETAVPVRKTIERNPTVDVHEGELQLRNISQVSAGETKVPVYTAGVTGSGDLAWSSAMSLVEVDDKTIEQGLLDKLQIMNADAIVDGGTNIPTMAGPNSGANEVEWVKLDDDTPEDAPNAFTAGSSLEKITAGSIPVLQIHGFKAGADSVPTDDYKVILRGASATASAKPFVAYTGKDAMKTWLDITAPTPVSVSIVWWNGSEYSTCRPTLSAGSFWYLEDVSVTDNAITHKMNQMCLPMYDVPGYCPITTPVGSPLSGVDADGDPIAMNLIDGKIDVVTYPDMIGKVVGGIDPTTGEPAQGTVQADGTITGYDGAVRILDPATGDSGLYRLDSGLLKG